MAKSRFAAFLGRGWGSEEGELEVVVGGGGGAAALGELGGGGLLAFEAGEDDVCAVDDGGGEAGEAGDVDAVAFVGGAGDDAAEEDDGVALLADLNGVVFDAGEGGGEVGELVVVGGEKGTGLALGRVVEVFDDGPGDGDAIEGGGTAADRTMRERGVALLRMLAVSCISTMKVERPRARSSPAPTRVKTRSTRPIFISSAGTGQPMCAMTARMATWRM